MRIDRARFTPAANAYFNAVLADYARFLSPLGAPSESYLDRRTSRAAAAIYPLAPHPRRRRHDGFDDDVLPDGTIDHHIIARAG
jgi:hypothetical protein